MSSRTGLLALAAGLALAAPTIAEARTTTPTAERDAARYAEREARDPRAAEVADFEGGSTIVVALSGSTVVVLFLLLLLL
ncbi:MAG: hypothetical protein ACTHU0_10235 [Kofleriaceae bacterium]